MVIIPQMHFCCYYFPTGLRNSCSCQRSRRLPAFPAALLLPGHSRHPRSLGGQTGPLPRSRCRPWITNFAHFLYTRQLFGFIKAPHATFDWSRPILCQAKGTIRLWMYNARSNRCPQLKYNYFLTYLDILCASKKPKQNVTRASNQNEFDLFCWPILLWSGLEFIESTYMEIASHFPTLQRLHSNNPTSYLLFEIMRDRRLGGGVRIKRKTFAFRFKLFPDSWYLCQVYNLDYLWHNNDDRFSTDADATNSIERSR